MNDQPVYKELLVWQKSMDLAESVIHLIDTLETTRKHYRLFEQLEAAVTSIPMNIAEGKGRDTAKEFIRFLFISRGSVYETLTLLEIFFRQGWIPEDQYKSLEIACIEVIKMLRGMIKSLSAKN